MENRNISPKQNCVIAGLEAQLPLQLKNFMYKFDLEC